jgi:hypothetical protein
MRLAEINESAWELSIHAMMKEGNKWVVCSTGKLREVYEKTASDGFKEKIENIINSYEPPENKRANAARFREFGEMLLGEIKVMDQDDVKSLMRYVLWDVAALERLFKYVRREDGLRDELKVRMEAESLDIVMIDKIIGYWRNVENTGKRHGKKRYRGDKKKGGYKHGR